MPVGDYKVGMELDVDETPPERKRLDNKLGKLVTLVQELLDHGESHVNSDTFLEMRGAVLDHIDDPEVADWLDKLRQQNRVPFRRYPVRG